MNRANTDLKSLKTRITFDCFWNLMLLMEKYSLISDGQNRIGHKQLLACSESFKYSPVPSLFEKYR